MVVEIMVELVNILVVVVGSGKSSDSGSSKSSNSDDICGESSG